PLRRRAMGEAPGPTYFWLLAIPHLVSLTLLVLITSGMHLGPGAAPYAATLTLIFVTTGLGYYLALRVLLLAGAAGRDAPGKAG
ncbi:MAG TPA: hypothetical protein VL359_15290, partial [bacterium]|nr:hypothetical protein [bacterium]